MQYWFSYARRYYSGWTINDKEQQMCKLKWLPVFFYLFSGLSFAKQELTESPAFGSFSLAPMSAAALLGFNIALRLEYARYHAELSYQIKMNIVQNHKQGFVFPFLCLENDGTCLEQFNVEINGTALDPGLIEEQNLADLAYFLNDTHPIASALDAAAVNYSSYGIEHRALLSDFTLKMYRFYIPAQAETKDEAPLEIRIHYTAPYYFYHSGKKESAFYAYSNDVLFFSFTPLAKWADKLEHFSISVDPYQVVGEIDFASGPNLDKYEKIYRVDRKNVDPGKLAPMLLVLPRRVEKQYKRYLSNEALVQRDVHIGVEGSDAEAIMLLHDRNLASAWCGHGRTARIKISLAKPVADSLCEFDGLALINGNTASAETLRHNGRVKSVILRLNGVERFTQDRRKISWAYKTTLQDAKPGKFWNPYESARYFTRKNHNENFNNLLASILGVEGQESNLEINEIIEMEVEILDIYAGKDENFCISELMPLYNCY